MTRGSQASPQSAPCDARIRYPSKEALDAAIASGATSGMPETLDQLDQLVATLGASAGPS
jgi:hypothetical protein